MIRRFRAKPIPPKIIIVVIVVLLLGLAVWVYRVTKDTGPDVQDFDACVAAGNPILETHPEQCVHKGESFFRPGQEPYDPKDDLLQ